MVAVATHVKVLQNGCHLMSPTEPRGVTCRARALPCHASAAVSVVTLVTLDDME